LPEIEKLFWDLSGSGSIQEPFRRLAHGWLLAKGMVRLAYPTVQLGVRPNEKMGKMTPAGFCRGGIFAIADRRSHLSPAYRQARSVVKSVSRLEGGMTTGDMVRRSCSEPEHPAT